MKIAIPMTKRLQLIKCCKSALEHPELTKEEEDIIRGLMGVFDISQESAFPTANVYVVDEEDLDTMLSLSAIGYSTVGDMWVIDKELSDEIRSL